MDLRPRFPDQRISAFAGKSAAGSHRNGKIGMEGGEFYHPRYLVLKKRGMLLVVDKENDRVQIFRLR